MEILWQLQTKPLKHRYTVLTIVTLGVALVGFMYNAADQAANWPRLLIFFAVALLGVWINNKRQTVLRAMVLNDKGEAEFQAMGKTAAYPVANIRQVTCATRSLAGVVLMEVTAAMAGEPKTDVFRLAIPFFSKGGDEELVDALARLGVGQEKIVRKASGSPLL